MSEEIKEYQDLEDQYMDHLIQAAFDLDDLEKAQKIREDADKEIPALDELRVRRTWQAAQEKIGHFEKQEKHLKRVAEFKRFAPQMLKIAACFMLVILIGVPVVLASSAEIRSKVIQMLVNIDRENEEVNFNYVENPDAAFAVPAEWTGEYFVSAVPEGMEMTWCDPYFPAIQYNDKSESVSEYRGFGFTEGGEGTEIGAGLEKMDISYADVNGANACIMEGKSSKDDFSVVSITWNNDEKMFDLTCHDMTKEEALAMARSVRKIIQ